MIRLALLALLLGSLSGCAGTPPAPADRSSEARTPLQAPAPSGPLVPGDARLDLAAVTAPSERTFTLTVVRGDVRQPFGTLTETVRRLSDGGLVRVQRLQSPRGAQVDSLTFGADLAPRTHDSRNPGRTVALRYGPQRARGTYTEAGAAPVAVDDALAGPAFDSNLIDLVARAVPFEAGFSADVRTYERASAGATETAVTYTVRVVGREAFSGREAVVVVFGKGDGQDTRLTLDPEIRTVLRQESGVGAGVTVVIAPS